MEGEPKPEKNEISEELFNKIDGLYDLWEETEGKEVEKLQQEKKYWGSVFSKFKEYLEKLSISSEDADTYMNTKLKRTFNSIEEIKKGNNFENN